MISHTAFPWYLSFPARRRRTAALPSSESSAFRFIFIFPLNRDGSLGFLFPDDPSQLSHRVACQQINAKRYFREMSGRFLSVGNEFTGGPSRLRASTVVGRRFFLWPDRVTSSATSSLGSRRAENTANASSVFFSTASVLVQTTPSPPPPPTPSPYFPAIKILKKKPPANLFTTRGAPRHGGYPSLILYSRVPFIYKSSIKSTAGNYR